MAQIIMLSTITTNSSRKPGTQGDFPVTVTKKKNKKVMDGATSIVYK